MHNGIFRYKHRVLCFFVSHINAFTLPVAQIALLKLIVAIPDDAKVHNLLPTIKALLAYSSDTLDATTQELSTLIISCFDASVAKDLDDAGGKVWSIYVSLLNWAFAPGQSGLLLGSLAQA